MALGTTDISTTLVGTALSDASRAVFALCTSANINKWSRYKPVTGAWPAGTSGKYGLNLPTNWNHIDITDTARLGDFRGYEHDKDVAGPVIWCLASNVVVPTSITPNITGSGGSGTFVANMNTAHDSVRILLNDLGYGSYYWGVKVSSYYKTFGTVSNGTSLSFTLQLDLTDPNNPTYVGFPTPTSIPIGTTTWRLFISSAAAGSWTSSQPAGYIEFPGGSSETWGSKTIQSTGTFTLTNWISGDKTSFGWPWNHGTYTYYNEDGATAAHIMTSNSNWHVASIPTGFDIKDGGGANIVVDGGPYASGTEIRLYAIANNLTASPIGPSSFIFHDTDNNVFEIEVLQGAIPPPVAASVVLNESNPLFKAYEYSGQAPYSGSNTINLVLVVDYNDLNDGSEHSLAYTITHNGSAAGSGFVPIHASQGTPDLVDVILSSGTVDTGDTVVVTLDAITP